METQFQNICGIEVRVSGIFTEEIIGVNNGKYTVFFWQGAEIARIYKPVMVSSNYGTWECQVGFNYTVKYPNLNKL